LCSSFARAGGEEHLHRLRVAERLGSGQRRERFVAGHAPVRARIQEHLRRPPRDKQVTGGLLLHHASCVIHYITRPSLTPTLPPSLSLSRSLTLSLSLSLPLSLYISLTPAERRRGPTRRPRAAACGPGRRVGRATHRRPAAPAAPPRGPPALPRTAASAPARSHRVWLTAMKKLRIVILRFGIW
jgi:hypothetical protein